MSNKIFIIILIAPLVFSVPTVYSIYHVDNFY